MVKKVVNVINDIPGWAFWLVIYVLLVANILFLGWRLWELNKKYQPQFNSGLEIQEPIACRADAI